ncbi:mannose-6-phosphate isomerase [Trichoplusia ni]|uniref:Mannose-6-phosphate isomerase n=1 Tax=Trichoplusia ni TaxID=7111 RepID=A0A7E5WWG3_TRINI|nr:mannose-6-phosphate isomerase [Trichoplusia ni]
MELQCKVQNYEWGKLGLDSTVAKLLSSANPDIAIDPMKPYAELWMGTHPNGPSLIIDRDVLLSEYIKDNLDAIGPAVRKKFGVAVPFLFKILSIRKALSIQAHPNKEHAEELHKNFPDMYKDPNHKPELAIALTPFEALCGFRPLSEIQGYLKNLPELTSILSKDSVDNLLAYQEQGESGTVLKPLFQALMTSDKGAITKSLQSLLDRLEKADVTTQSTLLYPLLRRLHSDFPGDVGCWSLYFMNYMQLSPGQAIFLKPNLPHAYLSGDCVECMACSDNVVRAGLTPKHIDVATLVDMLDYSSYALDQLLFNPQLEDANSCIWRPPVSDFAVVKIRLESGDTYNTQNRPSPSLLIVTSGSGEACDTEPIPARPGTVIFLKASRQLTLKPTGDSHLEVYQAICNV